MLQVDEDLQRLPDDRVGSAALDVGDESDAARIVLVIGIVESVTRWQAFRVHTVLMNYSDL